MMLHSITHGILVLSSSRLPITNSWVMGRANFSRKMRKARRTLILRRYAIIARVGMLTDIHINFSGHQSSHWQADVRLHSENFESLSYSSIRPIKNRTSWYKPEQTPGSILGEVSSSMEECRAETVGLFRKWSLSIHEQYHLLSFISKSLGRFIFS
jgi:hypothetical protein